LGKLSFSEKLKFFWFFLGNFTSGLFVLFIFIWFLKLIWLLIFSILNGEILFMKKLILSNFSLKIFRGKLIFFDWPWHWFLFRIFVSRFSGFLYLMVRVFSISCRFYFKKIELRKKKQLLKWNFWKIRTKPFFILTNFSYYSK
jgi:hypothetical protein